MSPATELVLHLWRHPLPQGHVGRCIGQTDLAVDRRRIKRLAHRVRQAARREGLPRVVHTSPLQRCRAVGRVLRAWGWRHHVHPDWAEMHFGEWDGRAWSDIPLPQIDAWCADFSHRAPPGGESLADLMRRLSLRLAALTAPPAEGRRTALVVTHGGCIQSLQWLLAHGAGPGELPQAWPSAADWRAPVGYMAHVVLHTANGLHCAPSSRIPCLP
ncbi:MAG: hypothetical protein RI907_1031 [Pseudomonadota bacterium]|jgi:alpha-ribazole phosphatase